jgi:hypothetical protein
MSAAPLGAMGFHRNRGSRIFSEYCHSQYHRCAKLGSEKTDNCSPFRMIWGDDLQ